MKPLLTLLILLLSLATMQTQGAMAAPANPDCPMSAHSNDTQVKPADSSSREGTHTACDDICLSKSRLPLASLPKAWPRADLFFVATELSTHLTAGYYRPLEHPPQA